MSTFIIVDTANLFYKSKYAVKGDFSTKIGMAILIMFNSVKKAYDMFDADHIIFAFEGRSWRKDIYTEYKHDREISKTLMTPAEQEEMQIFYEAFEDYKKFLITRTNCTCLQHPNLEADDLIAGFIHEHPNDNNIIISNDSDFIQLISKNVKIYNSLQDVVISHDGVTNSKGKKVAFIIDSNAKLKIKSEDESFIPESNWVEWFLFLKCMRGDRTDWIFSAYPGVRLKSSKKSIGLIEAFNDKNNKGYAWNNIMLQQWTDHNNNQHRVLDKYEQNKRLIDLSYQPDNVKQYIKSTINTECVQKNVNQVGVYVLKFAATYDIKTIEQNINNYANQYQSKYPYKCIPNYEPS